MNRPTYQTQFNKITEAYIRDEIIPFDASFCFCGTLAGDYEWKEEDACHLDYTYRDFGRMEKALFSSFPQVHWKENATLEHGSCTEDEILNHPQFEDMLFNGMCAALDVLKAIHVRDGEDVDSTPVLSKRQLQPQDI